MLLRRDTLERIQAGADPRLALRQRPIETNGEAEELLQELASIDARSRRGPWTLRTLRLIADHPGRLAVELAVEVGRERRAFKGDIRRLKELGLTISLGTGYELSPRGRSLLERLDEAS